MRPSANKRLRLPLSLLLLTCAACGGGGGGGAGGGAPAAAISGGSIPSTIGLTNALGANGSIVVRWEALGPDGNAVPIALFRSTAAGTVYAGAPEVVGPAGPTFTMGGLANGTTFFVGLAIDQGGGQFAPAGPVLSARTGAPIYVDAASAAGAPDGLTPATAFREPIAGILTAQAMGGGNVWIRAGDYSSVAVLVAPGVHVYGGFEVSFDPLLRDPAATPAVLHGIAGDRVLVVEGGDPGIVLDGLTIDGDGIASFGVDSDESPIEIRDCVIRNCTRGIRLRSLSLTQDYSARIVRSRIVQNSADGLSSNGAWNVRLHSSLFAENGQEGVDVNDAVAPDGISVQVTARDCSFFGNALQGMDVDLVAPPFGGPTGATFDVSFDHCSFVSNGLEGLLIDYDFELTANWEADVLLRGIIARNNGGDGIRIDADAAGRIFAHRVLASANSGHGISVTSESTPGVAVVSTSVCSGNQGAGISASLGNVAVFASHCVLAGNVGGGLKSSVVESSLTSSVGWLQPNPATGALEYSSVDAADPAMPVFMEAPQEFLTATAATGSTIELTSLGLLAAPDVVELAGDNVGLGIVAFGPASVDVAPTPPDVRFPTMLSSYAPGSTAIDDFSLVPASLPVGAGMTSPGGPVIDAGIFGAPSGGVPGLEDGDRTVLFRIAELDRNPAAPLGAMETLDVGFAGGSVDPASIDALSVRVVDDMGTPLAVALQTVGGRLLIDPPGGGWGSTPLVLELHREIQSTTAVPLAAPLAIPLRP